MNTRNGSVHARNRKQGGGPVTVPAAHVADMRYLHEVERKTVTQVQAKYTQYAASYVRSVIDYVVRASIRPCADDVLPHAR